MNVNDLFTVFLTVGLSVLGWLYREKAQEIQRLEQLISKTREEMARDYITKNETFAQIIKIESHANISKAEFYADISRVIDRLDKLCEKMDRSLEHRNP
tara:strand:+ start:204 stop:500 length:297 start_codon:yes stop_codon:yes gene_type:complete